MHLWKRDSHQRKMSPCSTSFYQSIVSVPFNYHEHRFINHCVAFEFRSYNAKYEAFTTLQKAKLFALPGPSEFGKNWSPLSKIASYACVPPAQLVCRCARFTTSLANIMLLLRNLFLTPPSIWLHDQQFSYAHRWGLLFFQGQRQRK